MDFADLDSYISEKIIEKKKGLESLYKTIEEIQKYGAEIVFGGENAEKNLLSAFNAGRAIGQQEGEIDSLQEIYNITSDIIINYDD